MKVVSRGNHIAIHPGVIIGLILRELNISPREFSEVTEINEYRVKEFLDGDCKANEELLTAIKEFTGIEAYAVESLQNSYDNKMQRIVTYILNGEGNND